MPVTLLDPGVAIDGSNVGTLITVPTAYTPPAGVDRALIVVLGGENGAGVSNMPVVSATYGGRPLTSAVGVAQSSGTLRSPCQILYMLEAELALASGTDVQIQFTQSPADNSVILFTLGGVDQAVPVVDTGSSELTGSGSPPPFAINTEADGATVAAFASGNGGVTAVWTFPIDEQHEFDDNSSTTGATLQIGNTGAAETVQVALTGSNRSTMCAASFREAAAAGISQPAGVGEGLGSTRDAATALGTPISQPAVRAEGQASTLDAATSLGTPISQPAALAEGLASTQDAATALGTPIAQPADVGEGQASTLDAATALGTPIAQPASLAEGLASTQDAATALGTPISQAAEVGEGQASTPDAATVAGSGVGASAQVGEGQASTQDAATALGTPIAQPADVGEGQASTLDAATALGTPISQPAEVGEGQGSTQDAATVAGSGVGASAQVGEGQGSTLDASTSLGTPIAQPADVGEGLGSTQDAATSLGTPISQPAEVGEGQGSTQDAATVVGAGAGASAPVAEAIGETIDAATATGSPVVQPAEVGEGQGSSSDAATSLGSGISQPAAVAEAIGSTSNAATSASDMNVDLTPKAYPFDASTSISGPDIQELLEDHTAPEESVSFLNGYLGVDNADPGLIIYPEHFQRGAWIQGVGVSSCLNMDYFRDVFGVTTSGIPVPAPNAKAIPGASIRFYQPFQGACLLLWTVFWTNNANTSGTVNTSDVYLEIDGVAIEQCRRKVGWVVHDGSAWEHCGFRKSRVYSGHWLSEDLAEGWHDASMKVVTNGPYQTRIWARHMIAVPMKVNDSSE